MRDQDRFRGCLIGGAAGDALGYTVEFMGERSIFSRYGERGITEYELTDGKALISDDTQMTLFTAAGLLTGAARRVTRGVTDPYYTDIYHAYTDWLKTQEKHYPLPDEPRYSWLVNVPELFDPRAPGNTCLSALRSGNCGTIEKPLNNSKGCGGVMRVAPVGLYFSGRQKTPAQVARIGAEAAAVTHGHPLGWMPAALLSQIIHEVSGRDETIRDAALHALDTLEELWPEAKGREYLTALVKKAIDLAEESQTDLDAIHRLGEGWAGDEALAVAVYCALKYENDFDRCLVAAVNHKGDSDSTGAIAGNILGAKLVLSQIPEKYTANLELKDVILEIADDLWQDCPMGEDDPGNGDPVWTRKYIEMTYRR